MKILIALLLSFSTLSAAEMLVSKKRVFIEGVLSSRKHIVNCDRATTAGIDPELIKAPMSCAEATSYLSKMVVPVSIDSSGTIILLEAQVGSVTSPLMDVACESMTKCIAEGRKQLGKDPNPCPTDTDLTGVVYKKDKWCKFWDDNVKARILCE